MAGQYLSADELRRNLADAVHRYAAMFPVGAVETQTLNVAIPPTVAQAADVLAVDLEAVVEQAAVEAGWRRWTVRLA